jgi:phage gp29-like protein
MSKKNKLMFCSDLSQCCIQVPNFELRTFEENTRINFLEEQKNKKKIEETEMEEQRRRESARRLDEIKSRQQKKENILKAQKAQKAQEAQEEKEAQEAAVAATPTDKEKDLLTQLTIERNKIFRKHVEPIFQQFSQAIRSGHYQDAAYMLNTKLTPKLYSLDQWT